MWVDVARTLQSVGKKQKLEWFQVCWNEAANSS